MLSRLIRWCPLSQILSHSILDEYIRFRPLPGHINWLLKSAASEQDDANKMTNTNYKGYFRYKIRFLRDLRADDNDSRRYKTAIPAKDEIKKKLASLIKTLERYCACVTFVTLFL